VRASNIFRKGGYNPDDFSKNVVAREDGVSPASILGFGEYLNGAAGDEIWELWVRAAKTSYMIQQCIATKEPAYLAKHAFQMAQLFNTFYHRHPILAEPDEGRKKFLLATAAVVRRELTRVLSAMGIVVPSVM
jgi:arginyl-tRNA synthetase